MIAVYPGSFDPITVGHTDIIKRMSVQMEHLHVLISQSSEKNYLFSDSERLDLVRKSLSDCNNVSVHLAKGLTVDSARKLKATCILRGLRAVSDFEYEMTMANMNKKLAPDIETMIVFSSAQNHFISSRLVKEVASHGGNLVGLVPDPVIEALQKKSLRR
jgi:pantetheine-phosphate adenylyltransferase